MNIVQTAMTISTLYPFLFLSYTQKNKHVYKSDAMVLPKDRFVLRLVRFVYVWLDSS